MSLKCLFGHQWSGCKCGKCGKMRNEGHNWTVLEGKCTKKCSICGKEYTIEHKWNGCKCEKCGLIRDEGHKWNGCTCMICKQYRDENHKLKLENQIKRCEICGIVKYDFDAVKQITDQKLLLEIALSSDNAARAAVQNIREPDEIAKVAISAKISDVAYLAVLKLNSLRCFDLLEDVATEGQHESISKSAYGCLKQISNENALKIRSERIKKATKHASVREEASRVFSLLNT